MNMKIGQIIRNKLTGDEAMVYQVTGDKTIAIKVYEIKPSEYKNWQFIINLDSDSRDILPRYDETSGVLWCLDKRKDNGFNSYEIGKMSEASIVLLYNKKKNTYYVLKNDLGSSDIDLPYETVDSFLRNPKGKLKVEWK